MLTREAWNAFLKILEEPPPRVIFVLATTEPGKIFQAAPPILSRCQRFDFRRITTDRICERLDEVLRAEGVEADEAALLPIARKADGALRDALSALDQVLAFSGDRVMAEDVRQVLGLVDEDLYFELFEILLERRAAEVFGFVEKLNAGGYDLEEFYKGLSEALRLLLRVRLEDSESLRFASEHLSERYADFAGRFAPGDLLRMLSALAELDTDGRFRKSEQQRILLEVLLLKFAMLDRTVELEQVIEAVRGQAAAPDPNPAGGARGAPTGRGPRSGESAGQSRSPGKGKGKRQARGRPASEGPAENVQAAWQEMIAEGQVLRAGQGIALRAAHIIDLSPSGELMISAASGTPGAEVLADTVTRRRIEEELSRRVGRPISIKVVGREEPLPPRVSQEATREQRLARLVEGDQGLQNLVDELDLELID